MARSKEKSLSRAFDYPYPYPTKSFIFHSDAPDRPSPFVKNNTKGRAPVLAFGSNQSPVRLTEKFGHEPHHTIPVERVRLHDFDVGYSAHITSYGAVPAMLQYSPGCIVDVAINWLDDTQLQMMHDTELAVANYHFATLDNVQLLRADGDVNNQIFLYVGARGQMHHDGSGIFLSAISCQGRAAQRLNTKEALYLIYETSDKELSFDDFVLKAIADKNFRRQITEELSQNALPFNYDYRIIK